MFVTVLLCHVLLATAALAIPSNAERFAARVARRNVGFSHQSQPKQLIDPASVSEAHETNALTNITHSKVSYTSNWAGAVLSGKEGTYKTITGTFVIPRVKMPPNGSGNEMHGMSAWVGIDGDKAILQTGVDASIFGGRVSYDAWFEWWPDNAHFFSDISFKAGDRVTVTVTATSKTSGTATITNKSTGKTVSHAFSGQPELRLHEAEWIVEDFGGGNRDVAFVNFGTVELTDATAHTWEGSTETPPSATLVYLSQGGKDLARASTGPHSVTIWYVGP